MIVKHKSTSSIRNTDKTWCIEWCFRHPNNLDQTPYFSYYKSYRTFDAVVDAYIGLQNRKNRLKGDYKHFFRINKVDFTNYIPL